MATVTAMDGNAHIGPDIDGRITLTVRGRRVAGVDGSVTPDVDVEGVDLVDVGQLLDDRFGYVLAGPWTCVKTFDGLRLNAPLRRAAR